MEENKPNNFDKDGKLIVRLTSDDSALIVRADGTVELTSHDLENSEDGYLKITGSVTGTAGSTWASISK